MIDFDLQLFAEEDDLAKLTPEELVAMIKSTRKEAAGYRSRITILEGEKTKIVEERDALKSERDTFAKEREEREAEELKAQKKWEDLATKEREKREKAEKDASDRIAAAEAKSIAERATRDADLVRERARTAAVKAGIVDEDDIGSSIALDGLKLEDGKVVGIDEWLAKAKETKPHKFNVESSDTRRTSPPTPPPLKRDDNSKVDFRSLSDTEFKERERVLLANIGRT